MIGGCEEVPNEESSFGSSGHLLVVKRGATYASAHCRVVVLRDEEGEQMKAWLPKI